MEQFSYIAYWRIETWTLIVAAIALAQPWGIALYKKLLRSGRIEIYQTGVLEIGFSLYGPTVALSGTLRAKDRELFIRAADVEVVKLKDESRKVFDWVAFRPLTTVIGRLITELEVRQPSGFLLPPTQPHQYNIMFSDPYLREKVQAQSIALREKWLGELATSRKYQQAVSKTADPVARQKIASQVAFDTFPNFAETSKVVDTAQILRDFCPWEAGMYRITLMVHTNGPNRTFKKSWLVMVSREDEENFRLNPERIIQELCTEIPTPHYFLHANYLPDNKSMRSKLTMGIAS